MLYNTHVIINILLTGCIVPNTDDVLAVKDINIRKNQYIEAIQWYIDNTPYHITFCENSDNDISSNFNKYTDRVEFLTYKSNPVFPDLGKGYKEMEILEFAYKNSKFLKVCDVIVKGTGRLILKNIVQIINSLKVEKHKDFISSWLSLKIRTTDRRFFMCSPSFLEYFLTYKKYINKHSNFEDNLACSIYQRDTKKYKFIYPSLWYNIDGIGGGYGTIYNITKCEYRRLCLKNTIYRICFHLGYIPQKSLKY